MHTNCKDCFHYQVCSLTDDEEFGTNDYCGYFKNSETTVTLPVFDDNSQEKIKSMQAKGYCFVNTELFKQLTADSGELASYKAKAFVANHKNKNGKAFIEY